jgi:serine acetyltransferase
VLHAYDKMEAEALERKKDLRAHFFLKRLAYCVRSWIQKRLCCQIPVGLLNAAYFPHPIGVIISSGTQIGNNVTIFQHVTIGRQPGKEYGFLPVIEDDVVIYAGAVIVGNILIGRGSIIGANAVVTSDVAPYSLIKANKTMCVTDRK